MRATTVVAIGVGIAIGVATSRGMQSVSRDADRARAAVQEFDGTQSTAFAAFCETIASAAKKLDDDLTAALKPYADRGEYTKAEVIRRSLVPFSNQSTLRSIASKKLTWCGVAGVYKMKEAGKADRQLVLGYDGRFEISPFDEAGWTGDWHVTGGALVLKSDRGWEKKLQLVPQFSNKDLSLQLQEEVAGK